MKSDSPINQILHSLVSLKSEKDVFFELRVALKELVSDKANFQDYLHFEVKT